MKNESGTRDLLIEEGRKALITHGYDGVGLGAILTAAGVPKGSFYYFFKSKEDFAGEVLATYERGYRAMRQATLHNPLRSPLQRLRDYFDALESLHMAEAPLGGCLYGVFAQTVSVRSAAFRGKLAAVFADWVAELEQVLMEAQAAGEIDPRLEAREAAAFLIEAYEGALIRMKAQGSAAVLGRFRRFALAALSSPPADLAPPGPTVEARANG